MNKTNELTFSMKFKKFFSTIGNKIVAFFLLCWKGICFAWPYVKKGLKWFKKEFISYPLYIMAHPIKGFDDFKREKKGKFSVALFLMIFLIVLNILEYQYTGFVILQVNISNLNSIAEISYIFVPILILTVSNWSVTTLFDGKGTMKEIFMMIGYALFPLVWAKFVALFVSNVVSTQEQAIYSLIISVGIFLMGYLAFFGLISIHEYGVLKCILSIFGTIVAALVICFVGILFFDLFQKLTGFIYTIYREIALRYL